MNWLALGKTFILFSFLAFMYEYSVTRCKQMHRYQERIGNERKGPGYKTKGFSKVDR